MNKKVLLIIFLSAILTLTGCGSLKTSTGQTGQSTSGNSTLTLATWDGSDPIVKNILDKAVKQFESKNPHVKVQIQNVDYNDYFTKLQTELAAGSPPDIIELGESDFKKFWSKGTLVDLSPLAKSSSFDVNDIYPNVKQVTMQDGHLPVIPIGPTTFSIFYNKTLFKQANIPFPTNDWTWEDFANDAKKLTKVSGGRTTQYGALMPLSSDQIEPLISGKGGSIISADGSKMEGNLDSPTSVSVMQWYLDLAKKVSPSPADQKAMNGVDIFGTGKVAMSYTGPWNIQTYESNKQVDFGVVQLPHWQGQPSQNFMYCAGYGISSKSKNQQLAWKFLSETLNPKTEIGQLWVKHGLPSFQSQATNSQYSDPNWKPFIDQIQNIMKSAYLLNPYFRAAQAEYLNPAITQLVTSNSDVKQTLTSTAKQMDTYFKQQQ